jgi:hypothetical protein
MKKVEIREDDNSLDSRALDQRSKEEAQKAIETSVQSFNSARGQMPRCVKVSSMISPFYFDQY